MKRAHLDFEGFFDVRLSTDDAQAARMTLSPGQSTGGREGREWDAISDAVDGTVKRAVQTWAPVVYWGLLARGRLDGFVCYTGRQRL